MSIQLWAYIAFIFVILTILFGFAELNLASPDQIGDLNDVIHVKVFEMREFDVMFVEFQAPVPNLDFFTGLGKLLTWDYSFFEGDLNIIRWIVFMPLTAAMSFLLIVQVGPVFISVIATARGFIPFLR